MKSKGLAYSANPPMDLYCDMTQRLRNQCSQGLIHLLTTSSPYHYMSDRVLVAREKLMHMGWNADIDVSTIRNVVQLASALRSL